MEFIAKTKTWWISLGDRKMAGVIEAGTHIECKDEIKTFTNELSWKIMISELDIKEDSIFIRK